jgi:hypothetical protein
MDIRKLAEVVERTQEELDAEEEHQKRIGERVKEITAAPFRQRLPFWCGKCRRDLEAIGTKNIIEYALPIAFYRAACPKGHRIIRHITERLSDPYFHESAFVRRMAREMERDLIQPGDPRFRRIYGDPARRYYESLEQRERTEYARRLAKGYGVN